MEAILWIIGMLVVGALGWGVMSGLGEAKTAKATSESSEAFLAKSGVAQRTVTFQIKGHAIGINHDDQIIGFATELVRFVVPYADLVSVELVADGQSVTKTNRGSQLVGAAVGGLALGGVGAIIGGLSGSSQTTEKTKSIYIRVVTRNIDHPMVDIAVHDSLALTKDALKKFPFYADMEQWYSRLQAIIAS